MPLKQPSWIISFETNTKPKKNCKNSVLQKHKKHLAFNIKSQEKVEVNRKHYIWKKQHWPQAHGPQPWCPSADFIWCEGFTANSDRLLLTYPLMRRVTWLTNQTHSAEECRTSPTNTYTGPLRLHKLKWEINQNHCKVWLELTVIINGC